MNGRQGFPAWDRRRGQISLIAVHAIVVVTIAELFLLEWLYFNPPGAEIAILVLLSLAIGGLQLRHSLAAARGDRPAGWPWTFLTLIVLSVAPLLWVASIWTLWLVGASAAMLLRGWLRVGGVGLAMLVHLGVYVADIPSVFSVRAAYGAYALLLFAAGVGVLYWSARLVQIMDRLSAARTELAEMAVEMERRRISRDLHDLLGRSLSAVSLKGDLAMRLLPTDPSAAREEVDSITEVARGALRSTRTLAHHEHRLSLPAEIDAAVALLDTAGITTTVEPGPGCLEPAAEDLFAWAVREATTNVLRHSAAQTCQITVDQRDAAARLTIVNDGAREPVGRYGGLAGLIDRAQRLAGTVSAGRVRGGRFRLVVEVPRGAQ